MEYIRNESARETVYQAIRDRIIRLDLKPGEALNYKELADEMDISRTPVREAILMLSIANLVVVRPQSGTFVAPIDLELVEIEQFTRGALEKEMVRLACCQMTQENKLLYEENLHLYKFYEQLKIPGQEEKLHKLDNDFHRIAFVVNGKENYYDRIQTTTHHIDRLRVLTLHLTQDDRISTDHEKIANAIMGGDAETAEAWVERHMNLYLEHLSEAKRTAPEYFMTE